MEPLTTPTVPLDPSSCTDCGMACHESMHIHGQMTTTHTSKTKNDLRNLHHEVAVSFARF